MENINPFVQNVVLDIIRINKTFTLTSNSKKSETQITNGIIIPIPQFAERVSKTSVFHNSECMPTFYRSLSSTGRDLLLYVILNLPKNSDIIKLQAKEVSEEMGVARGTFYTGLNQLMTNGIIAKRDVKTYWINPRYLYNGNRIEYFKALGEDHINIVVTLEG